MQVRHATSLPFSDPMGAVEAQTAQALHVGRSEAMPLVRGWRAVFQGQGESYGRERGAGISGREGSFIYRAKKLGISAGSRLAPALNNAPFGSQMVIFCWWGAHGDPVAI